MQASPLTRLLLVVGAVALVTACSELATESPAGRRPPAGVNQAKFDPGGTGGTDTTADTTSDDGTADSTAGDGTADSTAGDSTAESTAGDSTADTTSGDTTADSTTDSTAVPGGDDEGGTAYSFSGFLSPIDPGAINVARAGSAVPVKFSLGGDRGLDIFADGSPGTKPILCADGGDLGESVPTVTAGQSGLSYDPETDTYTYVWKTQKSWAHSCRLLMVTLTDGTTHTASFSFR